MFELLFVVIILYLAIKLLLGIGPNFSSLCRALGRGVWHWSFLNQYTRRGFLWACANTWTLLAILATLGAAFADPEASPWGIVALLWVMTLAWWLLAIGWRQLKTHKRQLPHRRR